MEKCGDSGQRRQSPRLNSSRRASRPLAFRDGNRSEPFAHHPPQTVGSSFNPPLNALVTSSAALLLGSQFARANISGINPTGTSNATIRFGDGSSFSGLNNGGTYNVLTTPWNGALLTFPPTTDGTTGDFANGSISATFTALTYALNVPLSIITQAVGNTGSAILQYGAVVQFQTDAAGLPSGPTQFPGFNLNGTVQPGGFASVSGTINYFDVSNAAYIGGLLDTVNYSYLNTTPGVFTNVPVFGLPSVGNTPLIPVGSSLTVAGSITFKVDPANISATPAPEPTAGLLTLLSLPLLLARRRALRA